MSDVSQGATATPLLRPRPWVSVHKVALVLAVLLLAGCSAAPASHPTAVIRGMAMRVDGGAYANTPVSLDPSGRHTVTDGAGNFAFTNLTAGAYTVHFQPSDGTPFDVVVKLGDGKEVECMFMPGEPCA